MTGSPAIVLLRGGVIVDGDEFLGRAGEGQFVKRAASASSLAQSARQRLDERRTRPRSGTCVKIARHCVG